MKTVDCLIDTEQMEDSYDSQHPECNKSGQEEERQDRKQFNDTVEGCDKGNHRSKTSLVRIAKIGSPETK